MAGIAHAGEGPAYQAISSGQSGIGTGTSQLFKVQRVRSAVNEPGFNKTSTNQMVRRV